MNDFGAIERVRPDLLNLATATDATAAAAAEMGSAVYVVTRVRESGEDRKSVV